ncbi:MAG: PIN domain-containing protein, partial [Myxococcota bacterium]
MSANVYIETSALLRVLLEGDETLRPRLVGTKLFTSTLTFVEAARAIARARREGRLDARESREVERQLAMFERSCDAVELVDVVLRRAREDFPEEPVRTLDALHLATLGVLDNELGGLVVATCDERVRRNAVALG